MSYAIQIKANGCFLGNDGVTYVDDVYDAFITDSKDEIDHFFELNKCDANFAEIIEVYNN